MMSEHGVQFKVDGRKKMKAIQVDIFANLCHQVAARQGSSVTLKIGVGGENQ